MSKHEREKQHQVDADYSLEAVPTSARKGFWNMFFVMLGFTFFSASMSVGAKLGNGLDLSGFAWACLIGGLILSAYCGILAYIGSSTGLNMDLLCRKTFGEKGSYLSSAILGFTQIGWFGVGVAMFSIPAAELLGVNAWALTIVAGLLMTATAATGMKALEIVSYISVPLIVVLGMYSMITATGEGGGLTAIFAQSAGGISLVTGIGYVIGSFISGGTATPNFIRFAKNSKIAVWTTVIAFFLGNTLMFCFGAVGGAFTGKDDIFYVMIAQGLAIPALIVLGANICLGHLAVLELHWLAEHLELRAAPHRCHCHSGLLQKPQQVPGRRSACGRQLVQHCRHRGGCCGSQRPSLGHCRHQRHDRGGGVLLPGRTAG